LARGTSNIDKLMLRVFFSARPGPLAMLSTNTGQPSSALVHFLRTCWNKLAVGPESRDVVEPTEDPPGHENLAGTRLRGSERRLTRLEVLAESTGGVKPPRRPMPRGPAVRAWFLDPPRQGFRGPGIRVGRGRRANRLDSVSQADTTHPNPRPPSAARRATPQPMAGLPQKGRCS